MATLFNLPLLGQTMQEGTILRWFKQEGEPIEAWEPLVEVMTDKVNMEVEPQVTGVVRRLLAGEGETVAVGAPIAIIGAADEPIDHLLAGSAAAAPSGNGESAPAGHPAQMGRAPATPSTGPQGAPAPPVAPSQPAASAEPPAISPRARVTAEDQALDWRSAALRGTGFEGMIVERDVRALLESGPVRTRLTPLAARIAAEHGVAAEQLALGAGARVRAEEVRRRLPARSGGAAPAVEGPEFTELPLTGMRRVIAQRLVASYQQAPHVPLRAEVDMAAAAAFRKQLQPEAEQRGAKLTFTDLVAAALVRGLLAEPAMNATLEGETIRRYRAVHLGMAVALEEGLTVPVLRDAQTLHLLELSSRLRELAAGARAGKLPPDAYAGGTCTLTNLGQFGIDSFDPILNPPQVSILGVGRIAERILPVDGAPGVRPTMHLTLTFDHRAVDGVPAARLLGRVKELLESPARLLL